jgi:hypothetical protein
MSNETNNSKTMDHTVPVVLDDTAAKALAAILQQRRAAIRFVPENEKDKRYEVYSWLPVHEKDGVVVETFPVSQHPTQTAADQAAEIRIAHLMYADLLLFQLQQAQRLEATKG